MAECGGILMSKASATTDLDVSPFDTQAPLLWLRIFSKTSLLLPLALIVNFILELRFYTDA
jgi:hypothetical protein